MVKSIIVLYQYEDKIKLLCNAYEFGYDYLYYYSDLDPDNTMELKLESSEATISGLDNAIYTFFCDELMSDAVTVEILGVPLEDLYKYILKDDYGHISDILDYEEPEKTVVGLYYAYLNAENKTDKEHIADALTKITEYYRQTSSYINNIDDASGVKIRISNALRLACESNVSDDCLSIMLERADITTGLWRTEAVYGMNAFSPITLREEILYKIAVVYKECIIDSFMLFLKKGYLDAEYNRLLKNAQDLEKIKESSDYFLPGIYEASSDKEKQIMQYMNYLAKKHIILSRPDLTFKDDIIELEIGQDNGLFKINQLYLCGIEEDQLYIQTASPRLIPINSDNIKFNIREYRFNREPYYFYIADANGIRLSDVTYLDLSEENNDENDYNRVYTEIALKKYTLNLNRTFEFFYPVAWPKLKLILDSYLTKTGDEYKDFTDFVISRACAELSGKEFNIFLVIFYVEFCRQKYYLDKNSEFNLVQRYEIQTRTHFIEKGNYICKVMGIDSDGKISYSYYDGREAGVYFRTDMAKYTIFRCISPDDYCVNDYNMYYLNSDKNVEYKFIDKNIEVNNGRLY